MVSDNSIGAEDKKISFRNQNKEQQKQQIFAIKVPNNQTRALGLAADV